MNPIFKHVSKSFFLNLMLACDNEISVLLEVLKIMETFFGLHVLDNKNLVIIPLSHTCPALSLNLLKKGSWSPFR